MLDEIFRIAVCFDIDKYQSSEVYFPLSNVEEVMEKVNEGRLESLKKVGRTVSPKKSVMDRIKRGSLAGGRLSSPMKVQTKAIEFE